MSRMGGPGSDADEERREAQARLDQLREEAGMPRRGDELAQRGAAQTGEADDPPLDWRLTPRNVILQVIAVALFLGAVWLLYSIVADAVGLLFSR